jgi:hypothetical protein
MQQHITILGWIYIILGGFGIVAALFIFLIMGGIGAASGDAGAAALMGGIGLLAALFAAIMSLPSVIGGWGLLKGKSWSRVLVIVLGCLQLLGFPVGTAIGIYSLWALTNPEAQRILRH